MKLLENKSKKNDDIIAAIDKDIKSYLSIMKTRNIKNETLNILISEYV